MHEHMHTCTSAHGISIPELPVCLSYSTLPLNSESMPMRDVNLLWAGHGKALVNTLARLSSDVQCSIMIELSPRHSHMKWCWISICFDFKCDPWFFVKSIADWLLIFSSVSLFCNKQISINKVWSHIASQVAKLAAIYSTSIVDTATVCWYGRIPE